MNIPVLLIIAIAVFLVLVIFLTDFRRYVGRQINALLELIISFFPAIGTVLTEAWGFAKGAIGIYFIALFCVAIFALLLILLALLINAPGITAFAFVLALSLVLLVWSPAGVILKLFRINKTVVPKTLKTAIAWTAFVGFLGLMCPEVITWRSLMGFALVGFIALAVTTKINVIDKIIYPLVIMMCLWVGWSHFFPEDFRSTTRYFASLSQVFNTTKDRGSIENETDAKTTYGQLLKDVTVLYICVHDTTMEDALFLDILKRGTIVKIVSHKEEVKEVDGQGFVHIQIAKANGSFVGGGKYWIEAENVQLATPRDIVPKDNALLQKSKTETVSTPITSVNIPAMKDSIFRKGVYYIDVNGGETPYNIVIYPTKVGCARYNLSSEDYNYKILFSDGEVVQADPNAIVRHRDRPVFKLFSSAKERVKLVVC